MFYERVLNLVPGVHLERRLAERVAARLVIRLLMAIPICVIGAGLLVLSVVHALLTGIWQAGHSVGLCMRDGFDAVARHPVAPR